jgi:iron complex outermembrane receptor protein
MPAPQPAAPSAPSAAAPPAPSSGPVTIRGSVRGPDGKTPLAGAVVVLADTTFAALTDAAGAWSIDDVPPGRYVVRISAPGFDDAVQPIVVTTTPLTLATALAKPQTGEEIVVTGSKFPEKRVDAPVTLERVTSDDIRRTGSSSYMTALSQVKGVQYRESGLGDVRISMRGFDSQFNTRMVWMVDGKLAEMPGNGLPMGPLLPTPSLDIKSIEVVVGPASALYGANAVDGVVNVITKTPWDQSGIDVALRVGNQNLADASLRVAGHVLHRIGYKLNVQYLQARDFAPDRDKPFHYYGSPAAGPLVFEGDLVANHYDMRQAKLEGFIYVRLGRDWNLKAGYGFSWTDGVTATNTGRNELRGWQVHYQTLQLSHPHWFAQVTRTATDTGGSYQIDALARAVQAQGGLAMLTPDALEALRKQIRFIDASQLIDSELQYRTELWRRLRLTAGAQFRAYLPSSNGTYLDDADGKQIRMYVGGQYVQADWWAVRDRLRLVGAVRVDEHSDYGVQVSPKASVVVALAHDHNLRVGYNRAFKSPTVLDAYLNIAGAGALGNHTGFVIHDATGAVVSTIPTLRPEVNDSIELGYKGAIRRRLFVDVVGFYSFYDSFISPLSAAASPAQGTYATYPDGTPTFAGKMQEGTLLTYSNFGKAQVVGANAGFDLWAIPGKLLVAASASYIHLVSFTTGNPTQKALPLNTPDVSARLAVTLTDLGLRHSFLRVQGRFADRYVFSSGFWDSAKFYSDGHIPARFVADVALGYRFDGGVALSASVFNVLDDHGVDVLGAPPGGVLGFVQLAYTYDGLDH